MWTTRSEPIHDGQRHQLHRAETAASVADVLHAWRSDAGFRVWFNTLLAHVPYAAFRWETPAVTHDTLTKPFEFVVLDDPWLDRPPDAQSFAAHFRRPPKSGVVEFANLGRDAILVVPCPVGAAKVYGHLAAFVRESPQSQRDALWQQVGEAMARRVGSTPVWLNTAGAGVAWLHVRLDSTPKYYNYEPYRAMV